MNNATAIFDVICVIVRFHHVFPETVNPLDEQVLKCSKILCFW